MAMAGLAAIVIFSFIWNWRFVQAYIDLRKVKTAQHDGDIKKTAKLFHSVASKVPEQKELSVMATFYDGVQLLYEEDKPAESLKLFNFCKENLPKMPFLDYMINASEIGVAFDNKDYDKFLSLAIQQQNRRPDDHSAVAGVASAYACKYAVTGDEQFKQQSLDYLEKSKTLSEKQGDLKRFEEYEDRILYRLETREIIGRKEFIQKFPNGWKKQQKEQNK